uniref:NADH-ubiquinone oxidoreductase chain 4L n=1 Tax=Tonicina zschaui TaxID=2719129 RepID=A0A6H1PGM0_9MOLL|nr:NADH dehydrogenase subunit 4L [Tonicina zschaui]
MMSFTNSLFTISVAISLISLVSFCLQRKHLLNSLLSLEMLTLSIFLMIMASASNSNNESILIFLFLTFAACEASLGLAMLVILIRTHGNDYVQSLSTNKY